MKWNNQLKTFNSLNGICVYILTFLYISKGECLRLHNDKRALHVNTSPLFYDDKIEVEAQRWADHLAATGSFDHEADTPYGENLYSSSSSSQRPDDVEIMSAANDWYEIS